MSEVVAQEALYAVEENSLVELANTIRDYAELSGPLEYPADFISGINQIPEDI